MNPVSNAIVQGMIDWGKNSVLISNLISADLFVPKIWIQSPAKSRKVLLLASGLHLEETSGPILLLEPKLMLHALYSIRQKEVNILIYPAINQYGLSFDPSGDNKLLRYNQDGINYNDGWGLEPNKKCKEVALVEQDILQTLKNYEIIFALSLHEDSEIPKKGYIYINGVTDPIFRKNLRRDISSQVPTDILASENDLKVGIQPLELAGAEIEDFCLVDSRDEGAMEQWLAYTLGVPTVLSESPFGLDLETRKSFHLSVIKSVITSLALNRSG